jgi:hypothetical protein
MSIGRNREEQELTSMLAKTLVAKEVLEPMEKIGWGHGTPPPADYNTPAGGQPTPTEGAPGQTPPSPAQTTGQPGQPAAAAPGAQTPKADGPTSEDGAAIIALYETMRDPNGLIMGKYKTVAEALKGSGHLANMAKQAFKERDELLARAQSVTAAAPAATPAAAPAKAPGPSPSRVRVDEAQARLDAVLSSIAENGGVLDQEATKTLSKAQRELADAAAEDRVQEMRAQEKATERADQNQWKEVDDYMTSNYPQSARFTEEVNLHLQSDPLLNAAVNALLAQEKRLEATELAWKSFARTHEDMLSSQEHAKAEEKEADLAAREQVRKEQVEAARKDAGVVTGSAGGTGIHENPNAAGSREEIAAMRDGMRREGDAPGSPAAQRFRELVIPLDPSIFGPRR